MENTLIYIITQTINNFNFAYMLSINILTYLIIKTIDYFNKDKQVSLIIKRIILILCTIVLAIIYKLFTNIDNEILLNSTIAAPVFYSWVIKPIIDKYKLGYNKINNYE